MNLRAFSLLVLISMVGSSSAQHILDLSARSLQVTDFPYRLRDVHYQKDPSACIGYQKVHLRDRWETYYFSQGHGADIAALLRSADSPSPDALEYSVRVNEFFLSKNSSIVLPNKCSLDLNIDFITHDEDGDHLQYSFSGPHHCLLGSEHRLHKELVEEVLSEALLHFEEVMSAGHGLYIDWNDQLMVDPSTARSALGRPATDQLTHGVFHTFNDFCEGNLDTTYHPFVKKDYNSHMFKVRFDADEPEAHYAVQILGKVYLNADIAHFMLQEDGNMISTSLFVKDPKVTAQEAYYSAMMGLIGFAIIELTRDKTGDFIETQMMIDPLTGSLEIRGKDKLSLLDKEISIYHSRFSKADELRISVNDRSMILAKNTHTRILISEQRDAPRIVINDGELSVILTDFKKSSRPEYYLIKRKKDEITTQTLTTNMLDDMNSTEVDFEMTSRSEK